MTHLKKSEFESHSEFKTLLWDSGMALKLISISISLSFLPVQRMNRCSGGFLSPSWQILALFSFLLKSSKSHLPFTPPQPYYPMIPLACTQGTSDHPCKVTESLTKRGWSGFTFHYVWTPVTQMKGGVQKLFHSFFLHWSYVTNHYDD